MAASSSSGSPAPPGAPAPFRARFGDTMLTKVFVGGLAWETSSEGLRQHFEPYGDILEAVVITDRQTGRSKGYGFVTFRDPEAARRSVQDPNPMIAGRRANCNIASLGPTRPGPPRGRAPRGPHSQDPPRAPQGPPYMARMPPQMAPHGPVFYPPQYGYWYPPDYPYQQAVFNPQIIQHYYPPLYGPTSPSTPSYQYMGYMPSPRAGFPPVQQAARPPFIQQQIESSFVPVPSLPPNFRLQLPPHAMSRPPANSTDSQSIQSTSAAGATNTEDHDA